MTGQNQEIFYVIVIGSVIALFLVGFIVTILFLYQRRQHRQEQEVASLKEEYEREVLRSQLEIQEGTFKMIGQELHDNIGQVLSVVKLSLAILPVEKDHSAYEGILNIRQILNKAMIDLANLTKSLHTDRIAQIGFSDAVHFELETLRKAGLLQIDFSIHGTEEPLGEQKSIFLFRMFQEMMNNILKHSKATQVNVVLTYDIPDSKFILQIADNGVGFNVAEKRNSVSSSSGVGLKSIFNRAKLIGANLDMQSQPGHGTTVIIELPLTG